MTDRANTPPVTIPADLYTTELLLGAWDPADELSYASTLDAKAYAAAYADGLRVPREDETARTRALHDHGITRALSRQLAGKRVAAFMGGHKLKRDSESYRMVADCAKSLAKDGVLVVSGGGPGAMEAALLGARLSELDDDEFSEALRVLMTVPVFPSYSASDYVMADGSLNPELLRAVHKWQAPAFEVARQWDTGTVAIGIPTWLYGHEPPTPLATAHAKYFENSIREDGLLAVAMAGVVFAEGSAGTLQEVFQDAAQNFYKSVDDIRSPMVFLDVEEFWSVKRPVRLLLEGLFDEEAEQILHFVTTADAAAQAILGGPTKATPALI